MSSDTQIKNDMNRMYRWTRHVYDASRKYFLLGRDHLINNLNAQDDEHICEIGCGTARNLIKLADTYPRSHFYGLDASDEMLKTARKSLEKEVLDDVVQLAQGYAQSFDPATLFKLKEPLNKLVFSYSLSIIPPWRESIDHGLELLEPGGELHIVDFGDQEGHPVWFRKFLFWWLSLFHVYHKPEILNYLIALEQNDKGTLKTTPLYKGYAYYAVFTIA